MADFIYKLDIDTSGTNTDQARASLEALKKKIIETELEIKKLKTSTKGNADAQIAAAGQLSQLETKLKGLRTTYNETGREALGLQGFTAKLGDQFAKAVNPIHDLLGQLGPIGSSIQGLIGKVNGFGTALGSIGGRTDKLSDGIGKVKHSVDGLNAPLAGINKNLAGLGAQAGATNAGLGKLNASAASSADGIGKLNAFTGGLTKAMTVTVPVIGALVGGLALLGVGIQNSIQAYDNSIKAQRSLEQALGHTSQALLDQASALQDSTGIQDDAITKGQAFAATLGLTEEQILKLTPAVLDLAAATGQDVVSAFQTVAQSIEGSKNTLAKYGVEVDKTANQSERVGQVLDGLSAKFKGQAEVIGNSGAGSITKFQNTVDDLEETLGAIIIRGIGPFVEGLRNAVQAFNDLITPAKDVNEVIADATQGLRDQQSEYVTLITTIQDVNTKEEVRKEKIKQLNEQYRDYLPSLVSEKTTNAELTDILRKGNDEFVRRIALKSQEAVLNDALENAGKLLADATLKEQALRKAVAEEAAEQDRAAKAAGQRADTVNKLAGKNLEQQIEVLRQARKANDEGGTLFGSAGGLNQVEVFNLQLTQLTKKQEEAKKAVDDAREGLTQMQAVLGTVATETSKTSNATADYAKNLNDATEAAKNGVADSKQLALVLSDIDKRFKTGSLSAHDLGEQVTLLNTVIAQLPQTKANDPVRDQLIKERDAIQKQVDALNGKRTKDTLSANEKDVQSYRDRLKDIQAALDLELSSIDRQEERKYITQIEADKRRNEALSKSLEDRIKLEEQVGSKNTKGGEIPLDVKVRISGLEEEKRKVDAEVLRLTKDIEKKVAEIKTTVKLRVDVETAEIEKKIADAISFSDLQRGFDKTFTEAGQTLDESLKKALTNATVNGSELDFEKLITNTDLPKKKIEELRETYRRFQLETEKNKIELTKKEDEARLNTLKTRLQELIEKREELVGKKEAAKVDVNIQFTDADEQDLKDTEEALKRLEGQVVQASVEVNVDDSNLTRVTDKIDKLKTTKGSNRKKHTDAANSPLAQALGLDDDTVNFLVSRAADLARSVGDAILSSQQATIDRRLQRTEESLDRENQVERDRLQEKLDGGLISQQQFEEQSRTLDKQTEQRKAAAQRKAFEDSKKVKRAQATIDYAIELAGIAASSPEAGLAAPVYYAVQAGIATARYIANLAMINSSTAKEGAIVKADRGQVSVGPSHADGGIQGFVGGQHAIELEGGEAIINKKNTKMFLPLLSAINAFGGNGVPLMAKGGMNIPSKKQMNPGIKVNPDGSITIEDEVTRHPKKMARGGHITHGTALVNLKKPDDLIEEFINRPKQFRYGGMSMTSFPTFTNWSVPEVFAQGGQVSLIPTDNTIANRRQLEAFSEPKTERVIQLAGEKQDKQTVLYISELDAKQTRLNRTRSKVSFGG